MSFINDDFLLSTETARELYHGFSEKLPIIDYHCHLEPSEIASDRRFETITQLWLEGDHYKWRAMRAAGIDEKYITGDAPDREKFRAWARTVPQTMRNPLYHWTHLELARVFSIYTPLNESNADEIYDACNEMLAQPGFSAKGLISRFNVETLCTTDDPADDLRFHKALASNPIPGTTVLPAWRPDKVLAIGDTIAYSEYIKRLGAVAGKEINNYNDLLDVLQKRHDFFHANGCRLSDHGMSTFYADDFKEVEIKEIFKRALEGGYIYEDEISKFNSALLLELARMDAKSGWVQQFHVGPTRDNNTRLFSSFGPNAGCDAIGDAPIAIAGSRFFDILDSEDALAKTIVYCLNPKDYEVLAAMAYSFNDGSVPGKMQLGSAWWFLDNESGMRRQMDCLSSMGLLSRFVGMLTDSRSFVSYTRHEYFRRILCDILGSDVETGRLPKECMSDIQKMAADISYNNAKNYFKF